MADVRAHLPGTVRARGATHAPPAFLPLLLCAGEAADERGEAAAVVFLVPEEYLVSGNLVVVHLTIAEQNYSYSKGENKLLKAARVIPYHIHTPGIEVVVQAVIALACIIGDSHPSSLGEAMAVSQSPWFEAAVDAWHALPRIGALVEQLRPAYRRSRSEGAQLVGEVLGDVDRGPGGK